ncbi:MAG: ABC transporter substrate-binding protein [Holosporaceae bacterium]|nr:ABC transporter substrate-binding protein [Holosporaceae bacterium]
MKKFFFAAAVITIASAALLFKEKKKDDLPIVVIANYGPLKDLELSIRGIKAELSNNGFRDGETVKIELADIACDLSLIPQIIAKLKNCNPKVMILVSTPIAQFAKKKVRNIPLVYDAVTDPVAAGLIETRDKAGDNITGSADMQNLNILLKFIKTIFPKTKTIGLPYLTAESNDGALLKMMEKAVPNFGLTVVPIPVDQMRDIPVRIQSVSRKVDCIYVGAGGLLAAMPAIASEARKAGIPVLSAEDLAVRDGLALASYGVNTESVGRNAGKLAAKLLNGADVKTLIPVYPKSEDHICVVNKKLAEKFKIRIPKNAIIAE